MASRAVCTTCLAVAVAVTIALFHVPAALGQGPMTCATYMGDEEGSRDRIVGMFLWVLLRQLDVTPNQAGTLIALTPTFRALMDAECTGEPGRAISAVAAKVIQPFATAALADPEIR